MNKMKLTWNKKVVSISFLALALFMLIGISYAYFSANVEGNDTAEKTTLKTGTMSLKLTGPDGDVTADNMEPGDEKTITFSVENTGNVKATYSLDIINVVNTFVHKEDLVYSITSTPNGGTKVETPAPSETGHLIEKIEIQPKTTQNYTFKLTFKETKKNQNIDQGKDFKGKIQINNVEDDQLAILVKRNNPTPIGTPDFSHGSPEETCDNWNTSTSKCDGEYIATDYGKGLFSAPDDDGTSYYFRGAITNNNIEFHGFKGKIIRINGDESVRIILNELVAYTSFGDQNINTQSSYTYENEQHCTQDHPCISDYQADGTFTNEYGGVDSIAKTTLENWYKENLAEYNDQIVLTTYCNDTSFISSSKFAGYGRVFYDTASKASSPILTCPNPTDLNSDVTHNFGGVYKLKVGLITADEMVMIGHNRNMLSGETQVSLTNYLNSLMNNAWSLTPYTNGNTFRGRDGYVYANNSYFTRAFRAVINLSPDLAFTGDGTSDNPYRLKNEPID